jgi:hypothetical protein
MDVLAGGSWPVSGLQAPGFFSLRNVCVAVIGVLNIASWPDK